MRKVTSSTGIVTDLHTMPGLYIGKVLEVLKEAGYDLCHYLEILGLTLNEIEDKRFEISLDRYNKFLDSLLRHVEIPAFGFKVGRKFTITDYGILGYAAISSRNVRQALELFFKYQRIVGSESLNRQSLRFSHGEGIIRLHCPLPPGVRNRFELEEPVGQWSVSGSIVEPASLVEFSRILFSFPRPEYADILEEDLRCPVYFDQPVTELYFPEEQLERAFSLANETTAELCEEQCETILKLLQQKGGLIEKVRRLIINSPANPPSLDNAAKDANMSSRSLRRHLEAEGTSFQEIVNEVRMTLATEYLRYTELSMQEIGYLLGYAEVSNFHRAFKRWCGTTPGEYREA